MKVTPVGNLCLSSEVVEASNISSYVEEQFYEHIDQNINDTSINPVANKVIYSALNSIQADSVNEMPVDKALFGACQNSDVVVVGSWSGGLYYINAGDLANMHDQNAKDSVHAAVLTAVADGFDLDVEKTYFLTGSFKNILWDGGQFVAIEIKNTTGNDGFIKIYSSQNGVEWKLNSKIAGYLNMCTNIVKSNGTYYLAVDRRMQYSADLVDWIEVPLPSCFDRDDGSPSPEKHIQQLGYCIVADDGNIAVFPSVQWTRKYGTTAAVLTFNTSTYTFDETPRLYVRCPDTYWYDRLWTHAEHESNVYVGIGIRSYSPNPGDVVFQRRDSMIFKFDKNITEYSVQFCQDGFGVPRSMAVSNGLLYCGTYTGQIYQLCGDDNWMLIRKDSSGLSVDGMFLCGKSIYYGCDQKLVKASFYKRSYRLNVDLSYIFKDQASIQLTSFGSVAAVLSAILVNCGVSEDKLVTLEN